MNFLDQFTKDMTDRELDVVAATGMAYALLAIANGVAAGSNEALLGALYAGFTAGVAFKSGELG